MFSIIYTFEFQPGKLIFFAWNTRCFWSGKNCAKQNSMELSMNLQFWHFSKRIIALIFWIFPRILTPKFDPYASSCLKNIFSAKKWFWQKTSHVLYCSSSCSLTIQVKGDCRDEQGILRQFYVMMCEECQGALFITSYYRLFIIWLPTVFF